MAEFEPQKPDGFNAATHFIRAVFTGTLAKGG
jgi:hypothetical protein